MRPIPTILALLLGGILCAALVLLFATVSLPAVIPAWVLLAVLIPASTTMLTTALVLAVPQVLGRLAIAADERDRAGPRSR